MLSPEGRSEPLTRVERRLGSQNGQRMRAKGHGLLNKAGQRGYLFVQLKAVMPKDSSDEVKALWQALAAKAAFNPREGF